MIRRLVLGALSGLFACALAGGLWLFARVPADAGEHEAAVSAPVDIRWDPRGRPFVEAQSWDDAFFAQGYVHARERLWQMELYRRAGAGRLAELIGPAALDTDIETWRVGVPELAARLARESSPRVHAIVERYVAGINAWLMNDPPTPLEFALLGHEPTPWSPSDVFAIGALLAWQSGNNLSNELLRLALVERLGERAKVFGAPRSVVGSGRELASVIDRLDSTLGAHNELFHAPSLGSNGWAVAPQRSATGHALFAFDSHDGLSQPNLTLDVHLFVGGEEIRGNSVAGLPGVINGYNEFMAWGFTNIGDSQDVFVETRHPTEPNTFRGRSGWYQGRVEEVSIPVQGRAPESLRLISTENGRLIDDEIALSLRWAPLAAEHVSLDALFQLNRATSLEAFHAAMDAFVAPSANVTYANIEGILSQRTIGVLPVRGQGDGRFPLRGDAPDSAWLGLTRAAELPRQVPLDGILVAANRPLADVEPLVSADNAPGYRERRIRAALADSPKHAVADMQRLQTDVLNEQARQLLPRLIDRLDDQTRDRAGSLLEWAELPFEDAESEMATLFALWYQALARALFEETLGAELFHRLLGRRYLLNEALDVRLLAEHDEHWPIDEAIRASFLEAYDTWRALDDRRWGTLHTLTLRHEMSGAFPLSTRLFDRGPYAASGGNATVGRARYSYRRPFAVSGGATTRTIIEMDTPMKVWMIAPGGQSGVPLSRHYNDQTQLWLSGGYDRIPARADANWPRLQLLPRSPEP